MDPVTFEVLKNKLQSIVNEQTITLKLVSGSPIVTEAGDFNTGIYLPDGTAVARGQGIISHASTLTRMVRSVISDCSDNPGIAPGDMFFVNDPWKGAPHQSDVGVVAPHYYEGKLVAWSGSVCHVLDVGGMTPGSWCVKATESTQEGVAFPPIKIVQAGSLRNDVMNAILNQSRLPFLTILDLKAMLASNNVAIKRVRELIDKYGPDEVAVVMQGLVQRAERGLRRKLAELPDGIYRGVDFLDHDGHQNALYRVAVAIIKEGDSITFDFTGTSSQAPGFVNCTEAGLEAGIATPLFITLGYDLPWNGGLLKPVKIVAEKGLICNARRPAPVGGATVMATRVVVNACTQALSRLVSTSPGQRTEARAVSGGTFMTLNLRGISQYGETYGTMIMDAHGCGEGAYQFRDGVDSEGTVGAPRSSIPNVETNEDFAPIVYLYRKLVPDTGGVGMYRGGNTLGLAFTVLTDKPQNAVLCGHGVEVPNSMGLAGGGPGACCINTLAKDTDVNDQLDSGRIPRGLGEIKGRKVNVGAKPGALVFEPGDVFAYSFQGGGGWGDPLEKDPLAVLAEVVEGNMSAGWARKAFAVVIDPVRLTLAEKETAALRRRRKRRRIRGAAGEGRSGTLHVPGLELEARDERREAGGSGTLHVPGQAAAGTAQLVHLYGESLQVVRENGAKYIQCKCGYRFGSVSRNWKDTALKKVAPPAKYARAVKLHRELEMREYVCPACGILHSLEIARKVDPPLWEVEFSD